MTKPVCQGDISMILIIGSKQSEVPFKVHRPDNGQSEWNNHQTYTDLPQTAQAGMSCLPSSSLPILLQGTVQLDSRSIRTGCMSTGLCTLSTFTPLAQLIVIFTQSTICAYVYARIRVCTWMSRACAYACDYAHAYTYAHMVQCVNMTACWAKGV